MTKSDFPYPIYILLLLGLFINSCTGQVNSGSQKETTDTSKPGPEIIGTPHIVPQAGVDFDPLLVSQYIRTIFQDSKGNYWFGPIGQGAIRYDARLNDEVGQGKTLHYFSKNEFFQGNNRVDQEYGNSVHAITEDQNGNIWFGTDHGAVKYDGNTFRSYTEENGLSNTNVGRKCILVDKAGDICVGTAGGVFRYHPSADSTGGKCFSRFDLLPPINVKDIMEDNAGNIWFASQDNGVFRYDGKTIKNIIDKEGLGDNYAGGMIQDNTGNFWFTMKGGICRYDPSAQPVLSEAEGLRASGETFTEFTTRDGLGGTEVWGIYMETSGIIWITARGSTTRYDPSIDISNPKAFTVFTEKDGINCCVQSMYQDRSGNMWWGAGAGLYRFDGTRFYQVKQNGPW